MSQLLGRIMTVGILFAVVFTALAHGAVEAWSSALLKLLIVVLGLLWVVKIAIDRKISLFIPQAALPLVCLLGLGLAQSIAWTADDGRRVSLSMDVEATRAAVTMIFCLLVVFLLAANLFNRRSRLTGLAWFFTIYGFAMAVFALIQHFTWNGRLYWVRPAFQLTSAFGPFVNHNTYAGYMELLMMVPAGVFLTHAVRGPARYFCGFAAVIMALSAIVSLSRGGMISIVAGILFLAVMSTLVVRMWRRDRPEEEVDVEDDPGGGFERAHRRRHSRDRRHPSRAFSSGMVSPIIAVCVIVAAIGLGIFWLGPASVLDRVSQGKLVGDDPESETFFSSRGLVWRDTVRMIGGNPVLGVGLGAYQTAYPIYTVRDGTLNVREAHNDYLQILADGGVVGGALALWFIFITLRDINRAARSRDRLMAGLGLGCGAGIFAVLVHSIFDFTLQIPSNALLFLLFTAVTARLGAATARSESGLATRLGVASPVEARAASY